MAKLIISQSKYFQLPPFCPLHHIVGLCVDCLSDEVTELVSQANHLLPCDAVLFQQTDWHKN